MKVRVKKQQAWLENFCKMYVYRKNKTFAVMLLLKASGAEGGRGEVPATQRPLLPRSARDMRNKSAAY
ncbi:hypothetical protein [Foetidibacter luteolus]|uniref:hypothetical protein n=1 Tax=Foetidibacter luteolus TaxID=2608880 RepID=UPI00129A6383|nr:hypothetical protein [Foetidibacter luteolus]